MSYAALIFLIGCTVLLLATLLSEHYIIGVIGNRLIPTYGFFQSAGHVVGLAVFLMLVPSDLKYQFLFLVCFVFFPAAAVTARMVCGFTDYWDTFKKGPIKFIIKADRYSAFGGALGGLVAYLVAVVVFRVPFGLWVTDAFCLGFVSGEIFSRIGCHANGCCYGRPITSETRVARMFSVSYTDSLQKAVWHGGYKGQRIFAAPLCLALMNLTLICLLVLIGLEATVPAGFIGGLGLMLYPYCRLTNDLLRVDRQGMGKWFTYIFLPVLFIWGFCSFLSSLVWPSPRRFAFEPGNLKDPYVIGLLILEYLLLLIVYGGGVEFTKKDLTSAEST